MLSLVCIHFHTYTCSHAHTNNNIGQQWTGSKFNPSTFCLAAPSKAVRFDSVTTLSLFFTRNLESDRKWNRSEYNGANRIRWRVVVRLVSDMKVAGRREGEEKKSRQVPEMVGRGYICRTSSNRMKTKRRRKLDEGSSGQWAETATFTVWPSGCGWANQPATEAGSPNDDDEDKKKSWRRRVRGKRKWWCWWRWWQLGIVNKIMVESEFEGRT